MTEDIVSFSLVTNTKGLLTKQAIRGEAGFEKVGSTNLIQGTFETKCIPFSEFGSFLEQLGKEQAIVLGQSVDGADRGDIVTKAAAGTGEGTAVARVKEQFVWSGDVAGADVATSPPQLMYLDFDDLDQEPIKGMGAEDAMASILNKFLLICPDFKKFDFWLRPSSGAYIYQEADGTEVRGLTGMHAFFCVSKMNTERLTYLKEYVQTKAHIAGLNFGFKFAITSGDRAAVLTRYPIDLSVLNPSRLVYAAGIYCSPESGYVQRNREALYWEAEEAMTAEIFKTSQEEIGTGRYIKAEAQKAFREEAGIAAMQVERDKAKAARTGLHLTVVQRHREIADAGQVSGMHHIYLDKMGDTPIWAWELVIDWEEHNLSTGRDPWEPNYQGGAANKAICYCRGIAGSGSESDSGGATIVSLAHGGSAYRVVLDLDSILMILDTMEERCGKDEHGSNILEDKLGPNWISMLHDLAPGEQAQIFEKMKSMGWFKSKTMAAAQYGASAEATIGKEQWQALENAMLELNNWYGEIQIGKGGETCVLRTVPGGNGYGYQSLGDFKQVQNKGFKVWIDGKEKTVQLGDRWLNWQGRKRYCGVDYRPDLPDTPEIEVELNGGKGIVLNLFTGFAIAGERSSKRACGAEGKNCIKCFFGEDSVDSVGDVNAIEPFQICPHHMEAGGGITAWLMHIHECVTGGIEAHTRWVADWFFDLFQNPGEVSARGGRKGKCLAVYGSGFGTGKSGLAEPIKIMLGESTNCLTTADTELIVGRFNSAVEGKLLVHAEEALWRSGKTVSSKLKDLIMGGSIMIERKGIEPMFLKNHFRLYVSSNELKAVPALPGERRFAVFNIREHKAGDREWFGRFLGPRAREGYGRWYDCIMDWEIKTNFHQVPNTEGLREQKLLGMGEHQEMGFVQWALDTEFFWDEKGMPIKFLDTDFKAAALEEGFGLGGRQNSFSQKFWSTLRALGINRELTGQKRIQGKVVREYELRATLKMLKKAWEAKICSHTDQEIS